MEDLPVKTQDYLRIIQNLHERTGEEVALGDAAERIGEEKSTANETMKELAARSLVSHKSYRGISLPDHGRDITLVMVHCHRFVGSFLVSTLGYTWNEVRKEAEKFEHAISRRFISRINATLGFPKRNLHGDPIPSASGTIASAVRIDLTNIEADATVVVDCIGNSDPKLLHYLATSGIGPRTVLRAEATPYIGVHVFAILDEVGDTGPKKIHATDSVLWTIRAAPTTS